MEGLLSTGPTPSSLVMEVRSSQKNVISALVLGQYKGNMVKYSPNRTPESKELYLNIFPEVLFNADRV